MRFSFSLGSLNSRAGRGWGFRGCEPHEVLQRVLRRCVERAVAADARAGKGILTCTEQRLSAGPPVFSHWVYFFALTHTVQRDENCKFQLNGIKRYRLRDTLYHILRAKCKSAERSYFIYRLGQNTMNIFTTSSNELTIKSYITRLRLRSGLQGAPPVVSREIGHCCLS